MSFKREACKRRASKFGGRKEWQVGHRASYVTARRSGWIDGIAEELGWGLIPPSLTYDECLEVASKYSSKSEWRSSDMRSYTRAHHKDWYQKIVTVLWGNDSEFSYEFCKQQAVEKGLSGWRDSHRKSYTLAGQNGWRQQIKEEMKALRYEDCLTIAKKYPDPVSWRNSKRNAYEQAKKNRWMRQIYKDCKWVRKNLKKRWVLVGEGFDYEPKVIAGATRKEMLIEFIEERYPGLVQDPEDENHWHGDGTNLEMYQVEWIASSLKHLTDHKP